MKSAIKLTSILDLDPDELVEQLMPHIVAALEKRGLKLVPADRPAAPLPPPAAVPAATAPTRPAMTGKQFLGWIKDQADSPTLLKKAQSIGKGRGYGWQIVAWNLDQVSDVYHEIVAKAPPGAYAGRRLDRPR